MFVRFFTRLVPVIIRDVEKYSGTLVVAAARRRRARPHCPHIASMVAFALSISQGVSPLASSRFITTRYDTVRLVSFPEHNPRSLWIPKIINPRETVCNATSRGPNIWFGRVRIIQTTPANGGQRPFVPDRDTSVGVSRTLLTSAVIRYRLLSQRHYGYETTGPTFCTCPTTFIISHNSILWHNSGVAPYNIDIYVYALRTFFRSHVVTFNIVISINN